MKYLWSLNVAVIFLSGLLVSCNYKDVDLDTLLLEMTNREQLTYFPEPFYTINQFSSYDRRSTGPEQEGWFANRDYTHFIRKEINQDRREFVLFDAEGPGAIVRFWMTFAGEGASKGIIRVYIDSVPAPVIADSVLKMISGGLLASEPLSSSVSPLTDYEQRGHNLYMPIPYSQHCKVTYECDAIEITPTTRKPSVYYNINYRTYDHGTPVNSFTMAHVKSAEQGIKETNEILLGTGMNRIVAETHMSQNMGPWDTINSIFNRKGLAIQHIKLNLQAEDMQQALRSTVLNIGFDGEQTVWVPVGEFFGTGYQLNPSKTWYSEVNPDGIMQTYWIMPFKETMELRIINFGDQDVNVVCYISFTPYQWKPSSMYFGSSWHEYHGIHSADMEERHTDEWHFDVNYIDIEGQGVYVGDALTVFNTADAWWGEGDEKIFVDGESFPSCIGTGTEDYYGYAWCRPEVFSHPFIAQPSGAGNFYPGMTVNMRYRALDAIPFKKKIQSNIELWHWALTRINMAMTTFYYVMPGFSINVSPDAEAVRRPVARSRSDLYEPRIDDSGHLEGEWLQVAGSDGGTVGIQSAAWYDWSDNSQLWWRHAASGNELRLMFIAEEEGMYHISGTLTQAVDYAIVQLYINDREAGRPFNGYIPEGIKTASIDLGNHPLNAGENVLTLKIMGKDPEAKPGNMVGIDYLQVVPLYSY